MIDNSSYTKIKSNTVHREAKLSENKAVFFNLLSESIYSLPRLAGIREIISNALDSMVRSGKNRQIIINQPSRIEPTFSVRDYGVGLTDKEIDDLYTCLGSSSKKDVEDEVGFFGVGALSPFAYVESFTVQSFINGSVRMYSIFMGENGVPQVAFINESTTYEENGLCVSYNVKKEEISQFNDDIYKTLQFIDSAKYSINNILVNHIKYYKDVLNSSKTLNMKFGENIFITKNNAYGYRYGETKSIVENTNILVMGGVGYEYDPSFLNDKLFLNYRVVIEAPIGAVSVQASREKLKMNAKTMAYIKEVIQYIHSNIEKEAQVQINKAENFLEAIRVIRKISILHLDHLKWRGQKLNFTDFIKECEDYFYIRIRSGKQTLNKTSNKYSRLEGRLSSELPIILDDTKAGGLSRIVHNMTDLDVHYIFVEKSIENTNEFISKFGNLFHTKASTLPAAVRAAVALKNKKKSYLIAKGNNVWNTTFANCTDEFKDDYEKYNGFYVKCKNRSIIYGDLKIPIAEIYEVNSLSENKGILIIDWEATPPPKATCFIEYFKTNIQNEIIAFIKNKALDRIKLYNKCLQFLYKVREDFKKAVDEQSIKNKIIKMPEIYCLCRRLSIKIDDAVLEDKYNFEQKALAILEKKYPLAMFLDYRAYMDENKNILKNYLLEGNQNEFDLCFN